MTRICFIDTETTSLDDETGEVWEIAVIVRDPVGPEFERLWQVRPSLVGADPESLKINRFWERIAIGDLPPGSAARINPCPDAQIAATETTARQVAATLAELLDGAHIIGSNPSFDRGFLRRFLAGHDQRWTAHYNVNDIKTLAAGYLYGVAAASGLDERMAPTSLPWRSTDLYRAVGVDPGAYEAHTALGDARLVRDVFDAVTGGGRR